MRYSFGDRYLFEPFSGPLFAAVPGYGTNVPRRAQNVLVSETHTFSPVFLNELRFGFTRIAAGALQENQGTNLNQEVGLPVLSSNPRDFGLSYITATGFSPLGDEYNNPQQNATNVYQWIDQATYSRGRHLLKFGLDLRRLQQNAFRDVQSRGLINFLGFTGNPLAEMLLGFPSLTGGAHLDNPQHLRSNSYNFFVHDTYRIRPNLTLSVGMRYEYNSPPVDTEDRANIYDPATQTLVKVGTDGIPRGGYTPDKNNWAPRLGLAWSLGNRGTTVLRAGYGVYYDQSSLAPGEGLYFNPPYFDFKLYFPLPGLPLTLYDPFPSFFPFAVPASALGFQRDLRSPYLQQWNFDVQQQIGQSRIVEFAYVGSKGTKLISARDINQPLPSPTPNPRPVPQFADINFLESRSNSTYQSFQLRFQQRLDHGLALLASYTCAKSLDDASSFFSSDGDPNFPQDSYDVRAERGRSNFDVKQRVAVSYSYDIPLGKGHSRFGGGGWVSTVFGGWQTLGIWTFQTGRPFTVALLPAFDNSNTGQSILGFGANDRPNLISNPTLSNPTPEKWFDTTSFSLPPTGSFGNSGRNILDGPGQQIVNVSLLKNTMLTEGVTLEFRAEAFNFFNHTNFNLPDIFFGSPTFGSISSAQNPRLIQFGLKLMF